MLHYVDVFTYIYSFVGGPADLSELREKDEIVAINGEKVKPFSNADFMYSISEAVLTGNLTLKVRRYDDEGRPGVVYGIHTDN